MEYEEEERPEDLHGAACLLLDNALKGLGTLPTTRQSQVCLLDFVPEKTS